MPSPYADDLTLALAIADEVDALTMSHHDPAALTVELKADETPVTAIDRAAERIVRERIEAARPGDAILGEEYGASGDAPRQWVVDPIDGTKNFIRAVPAWATLIALLVDGEPVVGVVSAPALGRRWFAAVGGGAWRGQGPADAVALSVSTTATLRDASVSYSSLTGWEERGRLESFLQLSRTVWRTRAFGDFWSYMLVAEGAVDAAFEPELALHDMAALVPIVTEAGGVFTSLDGIPGPHGGDAIASNGILHQAVVDALRP
ncbi:inositol monophosphatase family protein [Demequina sp. NBRC 110051]|uniref:inositol monophosphatase family protein n=1 Tax=Demequina sp. NBRC 110051 TaxID=1570340 RepID=UPI000A00905E|nr:inositol monophosphatase family protein [Demequina sp. NBRC 110051]